tara:strand:+ start:492 stop:830 length:339 start_codon:yes stop_codon:yes gene_type:complete
MSRLELILSAVLTLSIVFNVLVFIYARNVVSKLLMVSQELSDLQLMIDGFTKHLKNVYELDTFYGDQTLQNLLNHAESFNKQMETFEYIYILTDDEDFAEKETEETDDTEEN